MKNTWIKIRLLFYLFVTATIIAAIIYGLSFLLPSSLFLFIIFLGAFSEVCTLTFLKSKFDVFLDEQKWWALIFIPYRAIFAICMAALTHWDDEVYHYATDN